MNADTIFHVASLTKAMTAAAIGILVDRGALTWDTPVSDILPMSNPEKAKSNIVDFLSHRTGTTWGDALYLQSNNSVMLPKDESLRTFEYLPMIAAPRMRFLYNNHAYNIPGLVIEKLSGESYGAFMRKNLFEPLGMTRTFTSNPDDPNIAKPYNILSDSTPFEIPFPKVSAESLMFSGASVRSTMADLLRLYQALLKAMAPLPPGRKVDKRSSSAVIKQASQLFEPRIPRTTGALYEQTAALGWNRTQLPGALDFGWNSSQVTSLPLLGEACPGKLAIWHGGNMSGTTAAVILLPETMTAVVVLQNSFGLCDAADWTSQLLVDCIFAGSPQHDYLALAMKAAENGRKRMEVVEAELEKARVHGTTHRPLEEYVGLYENSIKNWTVEIGCDIHHQLFLWFQKRLDEQCSLRHYHHDVFVWNLNYDETVKRAQYCRPPAYYKFHFEGNEDGRISGLRWHHDPNVPHGEVFKRRDDGA